MPETYVGARMDDCKIIPKWISCLKAKEARKKKPICAEVDNSKTQVFKYSINCNCKYQQAKPIG